VYFSAYSMYSPRPWVSKQTGKNTQSGVLPRFHEFIALSWNRKWFTRCRYSRRKRQSHCCECRRRVWSIYFRLRSDKQSNPSTEPPPPPLNAGTKTIYRSLCWHDQTRRNDVGRNNHDVTLLLDLDFY